MADLAALQEIIGVLFNDPSLLDNALVHSSYVNEQPGLALSSNERLEFLGDAVLDYIIAERLFHDFPDCTEGEMTRIRAGLVRGDSLARIAAGIGLGDYLYLGRGEAASGGREKPSNLAGALEAVIAAVCLEQGMAAAREFILTLFQKELERVARQGARTDYKSRLQELTQERWQAAPVYHIVETKGPDHDREFTVEVGVGDNVLGRGTGKSKKAAETEAARSALMEI